MKPPELKTRIFLDSGDPAETAEILGVLGFLDGQTTNPSLVTKNPQAKARFESGQKFSEEEIYEFYKQIVKDVSKLIPKGSVSVEVYSDGNTDTEAMFQQGKEMFGWIPNAHIKYPVTAAGLAAAEKSVKENVRVNMTLCFSQEQAAAVYAATKGAKAGDVFVSPFIGRLDDIGDNGMTLISHILKTYEQGDGHVEVLAASVRTIDHFMEALALESDIITAPFSILKQWGEAGKPLPSKTFAYNAAPLKDIPFKQLSLDNAWQDYDIQHDLTDKGLEKFVDDWKNLIT